MKHQETTSQQYNFSLLNMAISVHLKASRLVVCTSVYAQTKRLWVDLLIVFWQVQLPYILLNQFKAAPLIVTEDTLQSLKETLQALVVNSANANSCTGQQGIDDARQTQTWVAQQLQIPSEHVAVASNWGHW